MNDFLTKPADFRKHIQRYSASIIHTLVHGFRAKSFNDFWGHVRSCLILNGITANLSRRQSLK